MTSSLILSASILSSDFAVLGDQIRQLEDAGVDWIHIDVMDGHFVPNLTMGPFIVQTVRRLTKLPLDVHLMVNDPDRMIPWFIDAGADWLSVQLEACPHIYRTLETIRNFGAHPGVVINPGTPPDLLREVLPLADLALVMSVNPGASGQKFIPASIDRIARLREWTSRTHSQTLIQVDGGVSADNIESLYLAGARVFVSATCIFSHPQGISGGVRALRQAVDPQV